MEKAYRRVQGKVRIEVSVDLRFEGAESIEAALELVRRRIRHHYVDCPASALVQQFVPQSAISAVEVFDSLTCSNQTVYEDDRIPTSHTVSIDRSIRS